MKEKEVRTEIRNFAVEMEKRMAEKDKEFIGKNNYKNMKMSKLLKRWLTAGQLVTRFIQEGTDEFARKKLVDTANFCMMLFERMGESD